MGPFQIKYRNRRHSRTGATLCDQNTQTHISFDFLFLRNGTFVLAYTQITTNHHRLSAPHSIDQNRSPSVHNSPPPFHLQWYPAPTTAAAAAAHHPPPHGRVPRLQRQAEHVPVLDDGPLALHLHDGDGHGVLVHHPVGDGGGAFRHAEVERGDGDAREEAAVALVL
jgi:hypothetical protein